MSNGSVPDFRRYNATKRSSASQGTGEVSPHLESSLGAMPRAYSPACQQGGNLMRKVLITVAAAGLMSLASVAANAAELNGKIASIDAAAGTITLEDGKVIKLPASVDAASLQVGSDVKVTYDQEAPEGGPTEATMVEPAS
jgi:hypothetical protein